MGNFNGTNYEFNTPALDRWRRIRSNSNNTNQAARLLTRAFEEGSFLVIDNRESRMRLVGGQDYGREAYGFDDDAVVKEGYSGEVTVERGIRMARRMKDEFHSYNPKKSDLENLQVLIRREKALSEVNEVVGNLEMLLTSLMGLGFQQKTITSRNGHSTATLTFKNCTIRIDYGGGP